MNVQVKICGLRNINSAEIAVSYGVDFIGLNFVPDSKRRLNEVLARDIAQAIKAKAYIVGVFQDAPIDYVNEMARMVKLDFVQLHGQENEEYMKRIKRPIIKKTDSSAPYNGDAEVRYMLLDRAVQGIGQMVNLQKAAEMASEFSLFFSGGLTPENVAGVVRTVKPFAVDVAGGIETNGKEDFEKIRKFIENAKGVEI